MCSQYVYSQEGWSYVIPPPSCSHLPQCLLLKPWCNPGSLNSKSDLGGDNSKLNYIIFPLKLRYGCLTWWGNSPLFHPLLCRSTVGSGSASFVSLYTSASFPSWSLVQDPKDPGSLPPLSGKHFLARTTWLAFDTHNSVLALCRILTQKENNALWYTFLTIVHGLKIFLELSSSWQIENYFKTQAITFKSLF